MLLHLGTLISVFIVYRKDIWALIVELFMVFKDIFTGKGLRINANPTRRLGFMIIVATIPTGLIGILFNDLFASMYSSLLSIGIGLIFTGTILWLAERINAGTKTVSEMKFGHAFFVGVMQGIAICPGVSRSGSTLGWQSLFGAQQRIRRKICFSHFYTFNTRFGNTRKRRPL